MNNLTISNKPDVEYEITHEMRLINKNLLKLSDVIKSLRERCDDIIEQHPKSEAKGYPSEKCGTVLGNSLKNFNEKLMDSIDNLRDLHDTIRL